MRTLANVGLCLVLLATLLWGGCLSCSQYFMFPGSGGGCCDPSGHCGHVPKPPAPNDCHIQPLTVTKTFTATVDLASLPVSAVPVTIAVIVDADTTGARALGSVLPQASPPDLCLIHSVFRI